MTTWNGGRRLSRAILRATPLLKAVKNDLAYWKVSGVLPIGTMNRQKVPSSSCSNWVRFLVPSIARAGPLNVSEKDFVFLHPEGRLNLPACGFAIASPLRVPTQSDWQRLPALESAS